LVTDLQTLRRLLDYLLRYDCISFLSFIHTVRSGQTLLREKDGEGKTQDTRETHTYPDSHRQTDERYRLIYIYIWMGWALEGQSIRIYMCTLSPYTRPLARLLWHFSLNPRFHPLRSASSLQKSPSLWLTSTAADVMFSKSRLRVDATRPLSATATTPPAPAGNTSAARGVASGGGGRSTCTSHRREFHSV